jgi:hypothetical protein
MLLGKPLFDSRYKSFKFGPTGHKFRGKKSGVWGTGVEYSTTHGTRTVPITERLTPGSETNAVKRVIAGCLDDALIRVQRK